MSIPPKRIAQLESDNARLREILIKCFHHLGNEIRRKSLNDSAMDGTQSLSKEIALLLDSLDANHSGDTNKMGADPLCKCLGRLEVDEGSEICGLCDKPFVIPNTGGKEENDVR